MPLFKKDNEKLSIIKEKNIDLEKSVQVLTEKNLDNIFNLQFVSSELALHNFRIDTLAFDGENNSFVIIEYKRDRSFSIIDQGYAYLALMLNNKSDFILEYNEKTKNNLKREDVDWSQSKVIFVANSFTSYQMNAINFKDLPIELWEVKMYDNNVVLYNQLLSQDSKESIKTITRNKTINKVSSEVKVYTLEDHLNIPEDIKNMFFSLREKIFSLDDSIEERPKQNYVAYRLKNAFVYVINQKSKIKIHLEIRKNDLDDPKNISRDIEWIGHHGGGEAEVVLDKSENLNYVFGLVEQAYNRIANKL
jgi:predicted transport protein